MTYTGIDYGATTGANRDKETGIHYGVIAQSAVLQAWVDSSEPQYGEPTCPKCGNEMESYDSDAHEEYAQEHGCADYACNRCETVYDSSESFPEEALNYTYEDDGYVLETRLDNNIFVLKSPYYTHAAYCSPCVPGAGDLDTPTEERIKTYCLGHDWFEDGKAPYPVYSVADDRLVTP